MADALGDILVERDGVAKAAAARMRRGGEEAIVRGMSAIDVRMRNAAEDGEVVAVFFEVLEIRRQRVIAPALLWEKLTRQQAEVVADAEHPPRFSAWRGAGGTLRYRGENGGHRLQHRQGKQDA